MNLTSEKAPPSLSLDERATLEPREPHEPQEYFHLNIGGHTFAALKSTLCKYPQTELGRMFTKPAKLTYDKLGSVWIPRDGSVFRHVLNFLEDPDNCKISLEGHELKVFKEECKFYGLFEIIFPVLEISYPMIFQDRHGHYLGAIQDPQYIWHINHAPALVCRHCDCAQFTPEYSNYPNFCPTFRRLIHEHGGEIPKHQPLVKGVCRGCRRSSEP